MKKRKLKKKYKFTLFLFVLLLIGGTAYFGYQHFFSKDGDSQSHYLNIKPKKYYDIENFEIKQSTIYVAVGGTDKLQYDLQVSKNYEEDITFESSDESIAMINEGGFVTGVSLGETEVSIKVKDEVRTVPVLVTNLIEVMPEKYNSYKNVIPCGGYSKEENDILDDILKTRVEEAGYGTRAGVIAAVRFLTLEFPYKVPYFSENGRLNGEGYTYKVDGEGRYYHQGLFLHSSRYDILSPKMYGPGSWGCYIYSYVAEHVSRNGLDCSGFITWVLLNGGFDPGDIGAGISQILFDCTDLGENTRTPEAIQKGMIKTGDLLSGPDPDGGHIAMVMGMKDGYYYIAECLWGNGGYGAIVQTYTDESLPKYFYWHIDMDEFYGSDGTYSDFWI